jgi:hypothetical protein
MRVDQLEAWVLALVDEVNSRRRVEDSRVELKADWTAPSTAARRIAGLANAAGSPLVLWVIGLDEQRGVVPVGNTDLAQWLAEVRAEFDQLAPAFQDVIVPVGNGTVVALLIDASRRPFVVRNAAYGQIGGGAVSVEVPWREGTSVRSARREDLLRILVPQQELPSIELRTISVTASLVDHTVGSAKSQLVQWAVIASLYVTPRSAERVVFPVHKAELRLTGDIGAPDDMPCDLYFEAPRSKVSSGSPRASRTIDTTMTEAIVDGPGMLLLRADAEETGDKLPAASTVHVILKIRTAVGDQEIVVRHTAIEQAIGPASLAMRSKEWG